MIMAPQKNASSPENKPNASHSSMGSVVKLLMISLAVVLVVLAAVYFAPMNENGTDSFVQLPTSPVEISNEQLQDELLEEMENLKARFPDLPEAMHVAAMSYAGLRQTKKAELLWRTCITKASDHVGPRLGLAIVLSERGNDEEAVEILENAVADQCVSPKLYHQLASVYSKLGDMEKAESTLRRALNEDPLVPQNWLLLGQTKSQLMKFEEAEDCFLRAIQLGYGTPTTYLALANACQRQGKAEEAEKYRVHFSELKSRGEEVTRDLTFQEIYQQALRPLVLNNLTLTASIYHEQALPEKAEELSLRILEIDPEYIQALVQLGSYYHEAQEMGNALVVQLRLVEIAPENVAHHLNLATLYMEIGDLASAEIALTNAMEREPDLSAPYFGLAQIQAQFGNLEEARKFAEDGLERQVSAEGYAILATICHKMGDAEAAAAAKTKAQQLEAASEPPNPGATRSTFQGLDR